MSKPKGEASALPARPPLLLEDHAELVAGMPVSKATPAPEPAPPPSPAPAVQNAVAPTTSGPAVQTGRWEAILTPVAPESAPEPQKEDPPQDVHWNDMTRDQKIALAQLSTAYSPAHVDPPPNYGLVAAKQAKAMMDSAAGAIKHDVMLCWLHHQDKLTDINLHTVPSWTVSQVLYRICFIDGFRLYDSPMLPDVTIRGLLLKVVNTCWHLLRVLSTS
jgi:hypothetical protein